MNLTLTNPGRQKLFIFFALLLTLILLISVLLPISVKAQETKTIVRVGWYESPFNTTDELGRRSGYAYDYQQKIAAYTGWTYEYVEGSWSDLLQMLIDGRIDLMSDVSYTPQRAEKMHFSALPMGEEEYYLYIDPDNKEISAEDYSTFNGKKIGVNKDSVMVRIFKEWEEANGVDAELVELTGTEEENLESLSGGSIDMYLSLDGFFDKEKAVPICRIDSSDFYFAVSNFHPELVVELNNAMNRIQSEIPDYNRQLSARYLQNAGLNLYLNTEESEWLSGHGPIRVGYQDNYLAFCATDPETGELTGALKDYLNAAGSCLENARLEFEAVGYPTAEAAMEAMKNGDVDCVFPTNLTDYDGEIRGVFVTPALMRTEMAAVVREEDLQDFEGKERIIVAVNEGNPNYDMFLLDHFPQWRSIYYKDTPQCLKAVADGQADCILISSYRFNNIADLCRQYHLTTLSTGVEMDYCFAVDRDDTILYSILAKVSGAVPESTVDAALTYYYIEDSSPGFLDLIRQHLWIVILLIVILAAALTICIVLLYRARKNKKSADSSRQILTAEDFQLFDDLPISYSVYHVTHAEHSELYDAQIIYVNHKYEEYGGLPASAVIGHTVRELYPHITEEWFQAAGRAALGGEKVERDFVDTLSGRNFHYTVSQVISLGYCAITYIGAEVK